MPKRKPHEIILDDCVKILLVGHAAAKNKKSSLEEAEGLVRRCIEHVADIATKHIGAGSKTKQRIIVEVLELALRCAKGELSL